jgi:hypothetical protein
MIWSGNRLIQVNTDRLVAVNTLPYITIQSNFVYSPEPGVFPIHGPWFAPSAVLLFPFTNGNNAFQGVNMTTRAPKPFGRGKVRRISYNDPVPFMRGAGLNLRCIWHVLPPCNLFSVVETALKAYG